MFYKALGVAFVAVVSFGIIRQVKPDFAVWIPIVAGVIILILFSDSIIGSVESFRTLSEKSGMKSEVYSSILKIVGIGYLTEYAASLCDDAGCSAMGKKVEFAGKITILLSAMPILTGLIDAVGSLMGGL